MASCNTKQSDDVTYEECVFVRVSPVFISHPLENVELSVCLWVATLVSMNSTNKFERVIS